MTKKLLETCYRISEHQAALDLYITNFTCEDFMDHINSTIVMSNKVRSLDIMKCVLPDPFIRDLLGRCGDCSDSLQLLRLWYMNLSPSEPLLDELLGKLAAHHETG